MKDFPDNFSPALARDSISAYVLRQARNMFPDGFQFDEKLTAEATQRAFERYYVCARAINNRYFNDGKNVLFDHMNGDQYATFLYFLSNEFFMRGEAAHATRVFYLNKVLHALDIFYEVELPDIFILGHAGGSVLGRGRYDNYLVVSQNCTVGNNNGEYPAFGEGVVMYANATVAGGCKIGANTHIAAHSFLRNQDTPGDCVAYGIAPDVRFKPTGRSVRQIYFK